MEQGRNPSKIVVKLYLLDLVVNPPGIHNQGSLLISCHSQSTNPQKYMFGWHGKGTLTSSEIDCD